MPTHPRVAVIDVATGEVLRSGFAPLQAGPGEEVRQISGTPLTRDNPFEPDQVHVFVPSRSPRKGPPADLWVTGGRLEKRQR